MVIRIFAPLNDSYPVLKEGWLISYPILSFQQDFHKVHCNLKMSTIGNSGYTSKIQNCEEVIQKKNVDGSLNKNKTELTVHS